MALHLLKSFRNRWSDASRLILDDEWISPSVQRSFLRTAIPFVQLRTSGSRVQDALALLLPILILLHLSISLPLAYFLNVWLDEAFSLHTTSRSLGYALSDALHFERQAPAYFVLLYFWRLVNGSVFFARCLSILFTVLVLVVAGGLARRYLNGLHPVWPVAALAFNPFLIWAATEIRAYALVLLLSALLLLLFYDAYLSDTPRNTAHKWYVLVSVLSLYTYYYLGLLLFAHGLVLLLLRRKAPLYRYCLGMALVSLCFLPMLFLIPTQLREATAQSLTGPSFLDVARIIRWRIMDYLLPQSWPSFIGIRKWALIGAPVAGLIMAFARRNRVFALPNVAVAITLASMSLMFLPIMRLTGLELMEPRHTAVLFLPAILFLYVILRSAHTALGLASWTVITLMFSMSSLYVSYLPMAKIGDWDRVARHISSLEILGQPILVYRPGNTFALEYYYSGVNRILPVLRKQPVRATPWDSYGVGNGQHGEVTPLSRLPDTHQSVWLLTSGCAHYDAQGACRELDTILLERYYVASDKSFFQSRVRLLHRRPNWMEERGGPEQGGTAHDIRHSPWNPEGVRTTEGKG